MTRKLSPVCGVRIQARTIELLAPHSKDIWNLALTGNVERLRNVLEEEPALARTVSKNGFTPLWWLPDDEEKALKVVELFLALGADRSLSTKEGGTAADYARKRGLWAAARRLEARE